MRTEKTYVQTQIARTRLLVLSVNPLRRAFCHREIFNLREHRLGKDPIVAIQNLGDHYHLDGNPRRKYGSRLLEKYLGSRNLPIGAIRNNLDTAHLYYLTLTQGNDGADADTSRRNHQ